MRVSELTPKANRHVVSVVTCCLLYSIKDKETRGRCLVLLPCSLRLVVAHEHLSAWLSSYVVDKASGGRNRRQAPKQPINQPNNRLNKTIKHTAQADAVGVIFLFVVCQTQVVSM